MKKLTKEKDLNISNVTKKYRLYIHFRLYSYQRSKSIINLKF